MTDPDAAVAVIGGGIAGASVAWHLSTATDRRIAVYERGEPAGETTAKSAAFFGFYGSDVERRLKAYGMARYNEVFADPRGEPYYDLVGRLSAATTPDAAADLEARAESERADGRAVAYHDGGVLPEAMLLPELDPDAVAGALYRPGVGYLDPRAAAREFLDRARENGVAVETGAAVEDVRVEDGRATGIVVDGEPVTADAVVCAAGPWNPTVAGHAGVDLPVSHTLAPILRLDAPDAGHTLPIVSHVESGVYARGHRDGTVLVGHHPESAEGTYDPDAVPDTVPDDLRETMRDALADLLPALADAPVVEEWVGVRSHTPDGHPIAGWTGVAGISAAAFHSSGIQLSPAVGDVVARQLVHGAPTEHHDALSIARFDGYAEARYSI